MMKVVGAEHEFHDEAYSHDWANRFIPTPERLQLFDTILDALKASIPVDGHVMELGIGPGYLARYLLQKMPDISYQGIDFSTAMLDLARARLAEDAARIELTQADLILDEWWCKATGPVDAIVTTWALHDLGGEYNTQKVYSACRAVLPPGGILLNGDFIKPDNTPHEYEPGRFLIKRHLEILKAARFREADCLVVLETELEDPTTAQNYACLKALA